MSAQAVLFDVPGPKARSRHLVYGIVGGVVLAALIGLVIYGLRGELTADKWAPMAELATWQYYIYPGIFNTLQAAIISVALATVLGFVLGMGRLSHNRIISYLTAGFVEFFRSVPVLMMMVFAYYIFVYTIQLPGDTKSLAGVIVGLTLYNSCVLAELIRAGVHGLPRGQREAGLAIGLSQTQVLRTVLLPQAITAMLPSLVSQLVVILKDTALGFFIAYPELIRQMQTLSTVKGNLVVSFLVAAVIFIIINYALTSLARFLERKLAKRRAGGRAVALVELVPNPDPNAPMYTENDKYEDPASYTR